MSAVTTIVEVRRVLTVRAVKMFSKFMVRISFLNKSVTEKVLNGPKTVY